MPVSSEDNTINPYGLPREPHTISPCSLCGRSPVPVYPVAQYLVCGACCDVIEHYDAYSSVQEHFINHMQCLLDDADAVNFVSALHESIVPFHFQRAFEVTLHDCGVYSAASFTVGGYGPRRPIAWGEENENTFDGTGTAGLLPDPNEGKSLGEFTVCNDGDFWYVYHPAGGGCACYPVEQSLSEVAEEIGIDVSLLRES